MENKTERINMIDTTLKEKANAVNNLGIMAIWFSISFCIFGLILLIGGIFSIKEKAISDLIRVHIV